MIKASPSLLRSIWLVSFLFVAYFIPATGQSLKTVAINTVGELQQEILNFGANGGDVTILLMADMLDMRLADLGPAWKQNLSSLPFNAGSLTITGQPASGATTIIDAAMKDYLLPPFTSPAELHLVNMTFINNCETIRDLDGNGHYYTSALNVELFKTSPAAVTSWSYTTVYGRRADLATYIYINLMKSVPLPEIRARTSHLIVGLTGGVTTSQVFSTYSRMATLPANNWVNHTMRTLDDPNDPLLSKMRADGTLLPPQYCNGTLLPATLVEEPVVRDTGPLFLASTTPDFLHALNQTLNLSQLEDSAQLPPPTILYGGYQNLTDELLPGPVALPGDVVFWGAPITLPREYITVTWDFNRRHSVFSLTAPEDNMFVAAHIFTGLAAAVPPAIPGKPIPTIPSVFPLQAINMAAGPEKWFTDPPIQMLVSIIRLPPADYMALLLLALKPVADLTSCMDASTIALAEQMETGMAVADVLHYDEAGLQYMIFNNFTGWGIYGWVLNFTLETPVAPASLAQCVNVILAANQSSNTLTKPQKAGVIVGSVVGSLGVLAAIAVGLVVLFRRHRRDLQRMRESQSGSVTDCKVTAELEEAGRTKIPVVLSKSAGNDSRPSTGSVQSLWQLVQDAEQSHYQRAGFDLELDGMHAVPEVVMDILPEDRQTMSSSDTTLPLTIPSPVPVSRQTIQEDADEGYETAIGTTNTSTQDGDVIMLSAVSVQDATRVPSGPASLIRRQRRVTGQGRDADKVVIKDVLGNGAWGTVFAGEWRGVPVAVKTMVFNWSGASAFMGMAGTPSTPAARREARAIMEAAIAASVGHPNLIATYCYDIKLVGAAKNTHGSGLRIEELFSEDADDESQSTSSGGGSKEYKLYLIQELCGCSLSDAVDAGALLLPDNSHQPHTASVLSVLLDIAKGLEYLHGKGIVHGDLKPDNVLLKTSDTVALGVVAKLGDFGLSTHLREGQSHVSGYNAGTPFFVAPEVVRHFRTSPASDMYSFGVIMWQLWTSQSPYIHNQEGAVVWNPEFGSWKHTPPPQLYKQLFEKCLSVDHYARPGAAVARQQIEELLQGFKHAT